MSTWISKWAIPTDDIDNMWHLITEVKQSMSPVTSWMVDYLRKSIGYIKMAKMLPHVIKWVSEKKIIVSKDLAIWKL